jgi:hypothetical protein
MAIKDVLLSTLNPENMNLAPVLVSKLRSNFNESRLFLPLKIVKLCYCNNSNNWGNMNQSIKINYLIEIRTVEKKKERRKPRPGVRIACM